jgi:hypothetical protein
MKREEFERKSEPITNPTQCEMSDAERRAMPEAETYYAGKLPR